MFFSVSIAQVYRRLLRPFFFLFDPENVHDVILRIGNILGYFSLTRIIVRSLLRFDHPMLKQTIGGMTFSNPIGLSEGFDKDAFLPSIMYHVGFGFMQIGSVTYDPYEGNPKPRLYRLKKSKGLVVYYGLKNIGVKAIMKKLRPVKRKEFPISISIAKTNSESSNSDEGGIKDYKACFDVVRDSGMADFYTINISCPNTFGGEPFTTPEKLTKLLKAFDLEDITQPVFIKMPVDLTWEEFDSLLGVTTRFNVRGVIIGNLTKERDPEKILDILPNAMKGGISGKPMWDKSNELISRTFKKYGDQLTIIGVGGVFSGADAYEKIKRGASLVQLITGMIYQGPQLIGQINRDLVRLLEADGYSSVSEAVGSYYG